MNETELDAIRSRAANASTGPWKVAVDDECGDNWLVASLGASVDAGKNYYVTTNHVHASEYEGDASTDADFIAHARDDIPALLAHITKLQEAASDAVDAAAKWGCQLASCGHPKACIESDEDGNEWCEWCASLSAAGVQFPER